MDNTTSVSAVIDGKTITLEAGLLAQQAAGSVTVQMGETVLFSAVTCSSTPREGVDFFPLQVEYREKFYAAGRFPGGFFKREARPSEKEILTMRLTDRPIRPMFADDYHNDVQVNSMVLSADGENDSDVLSMLASSAALTISDIPFMGPTGGVRVGRVDGKFVINPTNEERENSDIDLIYVGTREHLLMIEGESDEVTEEDLLAAMKFGHEACVQLIDLQLELRSALGLPEKTFEPEEKDETLINAAREIAGAELSDALVIAGKLERQERVHDIKDSLKEKLLEKFEEMTDEEFRSMFDELEIDIVRTNVLEHGKRVDGRAFDEIRPLSGQVGVLPRTHGSAIFQRGETQALCTVTLGTSRDTQSMDSIVGGPTEKDFMLHYNFPPYSVGECGRLGATSRREIGHGNLAERSVKGSVADNFPYTIRLVSDVMSSNGSTSMASVCSGTMAMMDAGIPLKRPVAGISVGLFSNADKDILVTDILGTEDHCGDMDFKVTGTSKGVTAYQVDLKIRGLKWELVEGALEMAKTARMQILDAMLAVIPASRDDLKQHAPRIKELKVDTEKIGEIIGPGGKNIRRITETTGSQIDIEDDGTVRIFSSDGDSLAQAIAEIEAITAEAEVGAIYDGLVRNVREFGAFVEILPGKDGLVHISELADFRVESVEDICKEGDRMWVKCIGIDERGRIRLSRKEAMKEKDAEMAQT